MEMINEISKWFGDSIMIFKVENYASINKEIIDMMSEDITDNDGPFAHTTDKDVESKDLTDDLHTNPKFEKIFKEIEKSINEFLKEHSYNRDVFDVYITKAWVAYTKTDQWITAHKHTASHYSLVYYVQADDQGNITFNKSEPSGLYIPASTEYLNDYNEHNVTSITYGSRTGEIIIFPSNMIHQTEKNQKKEPRISLSLDFLITMKEGVKSEHNLPNPKTWRKVQDI
jgi:uncharacterized protein (TIGR02466 family)